MMGARDAPRLDQVILRPFLDLTSKIGLDLPPLDPGVPGDPGLFGPGSEVWRVGRERVLLLGGAAALLMQISHPLIAAGVTAHSDFHRRPFDRLRATLDSTLRITFGDTAQAERASGRVVATHSRIRGELASPIGPFPAGTRYDATDATLALWVHATLVDCALRTYDVFVARLSDEERSGYYDEAKRFAALFGVSPDTIPSGLRRFAEYLEAMVESEALAVGPESRALARQILDPPVPRSLRPGTAMMRVAAAGLVPPGLRTRLGLRWTVREKAAFRAIAVGLKSALPLTPPRLRFWPHYRVATARALPAGSR